MSLTLLDAGLESRLVDHGRRRSRRFGVPVGGACDPASLTLTNALVGNPPDTAALEIAVKGPILRAESNIGCALVGAPFVVTCNGIPLQAQSSFQLRQGDELYLGGCPRGLSVKHHVADRCESRPIARFSSNRRIAASA